MRIEQLSDLEIFTQIVDQGKLAKAARTLGLTKNAVTRSLARLEAQLAKPLLLRTTRGVSLTEDGRRFYQHCKRILNEVEVAEDAIIDRDGLRGSLRIGVPTLLLEEFGLTLIDDFLRKHEGLELQVVASDQPFELLQQRLDIAIAIGAVPDSELLQRRLGALSSIRLAAAPSYFERFPRPKALRDLKHHDCLKFQSERPERAWKLVDSKGKLHSVPVGGGFSCNDSRVLSSALMAGLGIGIMANKRFKGFEAQGRLTAVLPRYRIAPFLVSLVYQRQSARDGRLDGLLETLGQLIEASMG